MAKLTCQHTIETTDWNKWEEEYEAGIAKFVTVAKSKASGELVGETIRFQVADGYAVYGIMSEKPLQLCHINHGDGYQIADAHIRGLNLTDAREMVRREKAIAEMFANR
jgi:hypothetical protein